MDFWKTIFGKNEDENEWEEIKSSNSLSQLTGEIKDEVSDIICDLPKDVSADNIKKNDAHINDNDIEKIIDLKIAKSNEKLLKEISSLIKSVVNGVDEKTTDVNEISELRTEIKKINDFVSDQIKENKETLSSFIDVISDKVAENEDVALIFKKSTCPFDPKIQCKVWENRPVKSDAPSFCGPCQLQKLMNDRGIGKKIEGWK